MNSKNAGGWSISVGLLSLLVLGSGCAKQSEVEQLRAEVETLKEQLRKTAMALAGSQEESEKKLRGLAAETEVALAEHGQKLRFKDVEIAALRDEIEKLSKRTRF